MRELYLRAIKDHQEAVTKSFSPEQLEILDEMEKALMTCLKTGRKILLCGNGGSASDSQHIAAEFVGRFHRERRALPAIALTTDTSILTAVANDYAYEEIFARQVEALGQKGDVLIAISTSGNSLNVLKAVSKAKSLGLTTFGFTGEDGGALKKEADKTFCSASKMTPHIQEIHILVLHALSEAVEEVLFGNHTP